MDTVLIQKLIGSFVAIILAAVSGWLISHNVVEAAVLDNWMGPMTEILVGLGMMGVTLVWRWWQKISTHNTVTVQVPVQTGVPEAGTVSKVIKINPKEVTSKMIFEATK